MKNAIHQMMIDAGMGNNPLCKQCRSTSSVVTNALGPWIACDAQLSANSIFFVGKIAIGDSIGKEIADRLEDVTGFGALYLAEDSRAYYQYTREIIERVYGDLAIGIRHVSFTNLIKCNNETTPDTIDDTAKDFCIAKNRFVWREVEVVRPRLVIFYTHTTYDDYIADFRPTYATSHKDNEDKWVDIGNKTMPWWDRSFYDNHEREALRLLRVGHPMCKNKEDFVNALSSWILAHTNTTEI